MAFNTSSKLWPSQRITFSSTWSEADSKSTLMDSPPMGMSASRLQSRLEYTRSARSRFRSRSQSKSRPTTTKTNFEAVNQAMSRDSHLRRAPSAWSNKQIKVAFRNPLTSAGADPENNMIDILSDAPSDTILRQDTRSRSYRRIEELLKFPTRIRTRREREKERERQYTAYPASMSMATSTKEERDLVNRLCAKALQKRRKAMDFYSDWQNKMKGDSEIRVQNYNPAVYKVPLCDLMLQLVTEREAMINRRMGNHIGAVTKHMRISPGDQELPIYCLDGITMLGKAADPGLFRNTFAHLSSLKKPADDPPGFERYVAIADMSGFQDDEILIHAFGNHLRLDGYGYIQSPEAGIRQRRVTENIRLPKGVYPERLHIGRSSKGVLVIQEPWKF